MFELQSILCKEIRPEAANDSESQARTTTSVHLQLPRGTTPIVTTEVEDLVASESAHDWDADWEVMSDVVAYEIDKQSGSTPWPGCGWGLQGFMVWAGMTAS